MSEGHRGHPLASILTDCADGRFLPVDGGWIRIPPWRPGTYAVLAFTGHAVMCVPPGWSDEALNALSVNGFGGAADPRVITALAGDGGRIDSLDLVVAARGQSGPQDLLVPRSDLAGHPRAQLAGFWRDEVQVLGLADSADVVVTFGRGLGGLPEIGFELAPEVRGNGLIAAVLEATMHLVCPSEVLLASVSPGNIASVRALLRANFAPIGSVQLFRPGTVDE